MSRGGEGVSCVLWTAAGVAIGRSAKRGAYGIGANGSGWSGRRMRGWMIVGDKICCDQQVSRGGTG